MIPKRLQTRDSVAVSTQYTLTFPVWCHIERTASIAYMPNMNLSAVSAHNEFQILQNKRYQINTKMARRSIHNLTTQNLPLILVIVVMAEVVMMVVVVVVLSVSNIDGRFVSDDDDDFLVDFVSTDCCGFICVDGCVSLDDDDGAGCGFFFLDFRDFFFADIDDANDDDDDDGGCCGLCGCGGNDTGGCCGGCCCA
mmetsp:Transcript_26913/g.44126  ORF Transcript_26913/g.44126 Transcript_26913/m.44126 type:complete len:196 (+) Transcript_26913:568-1155(+)